METSEEFLQSVLDKSKAAERKARKRTVTLSVIPIVVAALVLGYVTIEVQGKTKQLATSNAKLKASQEEVAVAELNMQDLTKQSENLLAELNRILKETSDAQQQLDEIRDSIRAVEAQERVDALKEQLTQTTENIEAARKLPSPRQLEPRPSQRLVARSSIDPQNYMAVFEWSEIAGAEGYFFEVSEAADTFTKSSSRQEMVLVGRGKVAGDRTYGRLKIRVSPGNNSFRWRVWAVDAEGIAGTRSGWAAFSVDLREKLAVLPEA